MQTILITCDNCLTEYPDDKAVSDLWIFVEGYEKLLQWKKRDFCSTMCIVEFYTTKLKMLLEDAEDAT